MPLDSDLASILACPQCKKDLTLSDNEKNLICETCKVAFPIRDNVPVMLVEEATPLREMSMTNKEGTPLPAGEQVGFTVVEGKSLGAKISLGKGRCRALGRSLDETERTKVFSVDSVVSLDESSKRVVMGYVSKQFRKSGKQSEGGLGGFQREEDFQLSDSSVSRLHAMLFYDETGVGVLDLVSKNGTYVNGVEVESKILKKGDLITIGTTKIRFEGN